MVDSQSIDDEVRAAVTRGDLERAATLVIRRHGSEVHGYLAALAHHRHDVIQEVFSVFCEALWRGLPSFEWRSSLRTWLYAVARNCFLQLERKASRRPEQRLGTGTAQQLADEVIEGSRRMIEAERTSALNELRAQLDEEEQTLLILRIDRGLGWSEVAEVLYGPEHEADEAEREKTRARLRKRMARIREKVHELAVARGFVEQS